MNSKHTEGKEILIRTIKEYQQIIDDYKYLPWGEFKNKYKTESLEEAQRDFRMKILE